MTTPPPQLLVDCLRACATILVEYYTEHTTPTETASTGSRGPNMSHLGFAFRTGKQAVRILTEAVEKKSKHQLTVRRAEENLFDSSAPDASINLVVCTHDTPTNLTVRLFADNMLLFRLVPSKSGLQVCEPSQEALMHVVLYPHVTNGIYRRWLFGLVQRYAQLSEVSERNDIIARLRGPEIRVSEAANALAKLGYTAADMQAALDAINQH